MYCKKLPRLNIDSGALLFNQNQMNASKVSVSSDELGNVIRQSSNPEYGYIIVTQRVPIMKGRFMNAQNRSAIIAGKMEDLQEMKLIAGQELDGKIYIIESLLQSDPNDVTKDMKLAGKDGIPCLLDDCPIYRQSFYTTNLGVQDILIAHNNVDEIKNVTNTKAIRSHQGVKL